MFNRKLFYNKKSINELIKDLKNKDDEKIEKIEKIDKPNIKDDNNTLNNDINKNIINLPKKLKYIGKIS